MLRPALLSLLLTSTALAQTELPPPAPLDGAVDVPTTTPTTTPTTPPTPVDPAGGLIGDAPPVDGDAAKAPATTPATPRERVRLVYTPGAFADRCPSVDVVREKVRGHLGYDPFGEPATRVVVLLLDGADAMPARARVELLDPQLTPLGSRVIDANDGCDELVATAALQMSIALDPLAAPLPSTLPSTPETTPPTTPPTPPATTPPPVRSFQAPEPRDPFAIRLILSLDAHVAMLMAQDPALFGIGIGAGARSDWWSVRGEFRFDFGGDDEDGIDSFPLLVSGLPCVHLPFSDLGEDGRFEFTGCLVATTGIVPVSGSNNGVGVYVGGGARTGIDWHFDDDTALRVFFQLEGAALRASWTTSELGAFSSSPVNIMFGLGGDIGDW